MTIEMLTDTLRHSPEAVENVVALKEILAGMTEDDIRALVPDTPTQANPKKFAEMTAEEKIDRLAAVVRDLIENDRQASQKMWDMNRTFLRHVHGPDGDVATRVDELRAYMGENKPQRDPNYDPLDEVSSLEYAALSKAQQYVGGALRGL